MVICPEASKAQNSIAAVSALGSTVWVFDAPLELLVQSLDGVARPDRPPLAWREAGEREQFVAGLL
jgi:hypothetical protein